MTEVPPAKNKKTQCADQESAPSCVHSLWGLTGVCSGFVLCADPDPKGNLPSKSFYLEGKRLKPHGGGKRMEELRD